ncbi:hypothetical protein DL771_009419 [Monosporascus sp. 5C6A]|nr:hypothetical protein DL771_009419 [Monosporascus sp. 5C6A]
MEASPLCSLCASLPLADLPSFPDEKIGRTLSGYPNIHHIFWRDAQAGVPIPRFGVQHYPDLAGLRAAAAQGCVLCRAIEGQAGELLSDIAKLGGEEKLGLLALEPSWDLWVTRRPNGEGLWVVTRSKEEGHRWMFPVAAVAFCSDEDDPKPASSKGRVVKEVPDDTTLAHVVAWLAECDKHPHCVPQKPQMPIRLIDVGTDAAQVTLVEPGQAVCDRYVALSYRWGEGVKHFATAEESQAARRAGIIVADLPRTLRDAVALTRRIGLRYLWIDALCIFQDDLADWGRDSANIGAVYAGAYLTVAATQAEDCEGGLFRARRRREYFRLPAGDAGRYVPACTLPLDREVIPNYHVQLRGEPLSTRAWGLQERVLSRRTLHFASEQMYFECLEGFYAEDGTVVPYRMATVQSEQGVNEHVDARRRAASQTGVGREGLIGAWWEILVEYGPKELSVPEDKLPAISGIARVMQERTGDEYLAGLWKGHLIEGLCWQPLSCRAVEEWRAPSWSWAAVDGVPAAGWFYGEHAETATVIDAQVEVDGRNPFGRVKDGWIKLEAPLVRLGLSEGVGPTGHLLLKPEKGNDQGTATMLDTLDRRYEKSAGVLRGMELFALVLAAQFGGPQMPDPERQRPTWHALIVTPVKGREGAMRRVGMMLLGKDSLGEGELDARAVVTII